MPKLKPYQHDYQRPSESIKELADIPATIPSCPAMDYSVPLTPQEYKQIERWKLPGWASYLEGKKLLTKS